MLVVVLLPLPVRGRVVSAWAELRSPGAPAELRIPGAPAEARNPGASAEARNPGASAEARNLAALGQGGRFDTGPPGRSEAAQVLRLPAAGWWW